MAGVLVVGCVTLGLEALAEQLAGSGEAQTRIHAGVRVPVPSQDGGLRAGLVLLLAGLRFWLAVLVLIGVLMVLDRTLLGPTIAGFVSATIVDMGGRLRRLKPREAGDETAG